MYIDNGTPKSRQFDDVYFSQLGGLEESEYVFCRGSGLVDKLASDQPITIGELGFGTGLNFLTAWNTWRKAGRRQLIHFVSIEKFPLEQEQLSAALKEFTSLAHLTEQLVASYPTKAAPGFHHRQFEGGKVHLTLVFDDVLPALEQMVGGADIWLFDGFAPAKNPEMWSLEVFQGVASHCFPGSTFSTFSAARRVRDNLTATDFTWEKIPGYGRKREMLVGSYSGPTKTERLFGPNAYLPHRTRITVAGAGVSGITCTNQLGHSGFQVRVIDKSNKIGAGASGNPVGLLHMPLNSGATAGGGFFRQATATAYHAIKGLPMVRQNLSGIIHLPFQKSAKRLFMREPLSNEIGHDHLPKAAAELSDFAGLPIPIDGWLVPQAGWFSPRDWLESLVSEGVEFNFGQEIQRVLPQTEDVLIICCGHDSKGLLPHLPLRALPGQVTLMSATAQTKTLKRPVAYGGYITPALANSHLVGATFRRNTSDDHPTDFDNQLNLARLQEHLGVSGGQIVGARASTRGNSTDRIPLVGPINASGKVWSSTAHGSRGLANSLLSAAIITHALQHRLLPVSRRSFAAIHPSRFPGCDA